MIKEKENTKSTKLAEERTRGIFRYWPRIANAADDVIFMAFIMKVIRQQLDLLKFCRYGTN